MTSKLLCIGECMIEMAPDGTGHYAMGFAGDTFNTAWYAAKLGLNVGYLSAVGDDEPSARMTRFMADAGVTPHLTVRHGRTVGLYMISLNNGERSFAYWRDTAAARTLADDLDCLPDLGKGDVAFFSGITLAILTDDARARLLSVLDAARAKGITVAFDPNLRPRLWPDDATMCAAITAGGAVADIVLPSFEDEASFFGDTTPEDTAQRYGNAGLVVVKNGADPVVIRMRDKISTVVPETVATIVDTTAAGDSFNAGFLNALLGGASPEDAAARACALSAKVITARGALVELS